MRAHELTEARRNPDINSSNRLSDGIDDLLKWTDQDGYYVSFTKIPKVGINPQSDYNTPLGVYAYPLFIDSIKAQLEMDSIPFAGKEPYMNVLKSTVQPLDIGLLSETGYNELARRVIEWLVPRIQIMSEDFQPLSQEHAIAFFEGAKDIIAPSPLPGKRFWTLSRWAAIMAKHGENSDNFLSVSDVEQLRDIKPSKGHQYLWNKLLREIGISLVLDRGRGIIHNNEPTQAVFLDPRVFKLVDRIANPRRTPTRITITTPKELMRVLKKLGYLMASYRMTILLSILHVAYSGVESTFNLFPSKEISQKSKTGYKEVRILLKPQGDPEEYVWLVKEVAERVGIDLISLATRFRIGWHGSPEGIMGILAILVGEEEAREITSR